MLCKHITYTKEASRKRWRSMCTHGACIVEGIDTSFSVMAVTPQTPKCHHNRGAAEVVVTFGSLWCHSHDRKRGINFYSIMVPQKLTLNKESLASQTASQLPKFKEQSHCKHWVTWPDCFATPCNHCDVTTGLVSLNYGDTFDKKMS